MLLGRHGLSRRCPSVAQTKGSDSTSKDQPRAVKKHGDAEQGHQAGESVEDGSHRSSH